MEKANVRQRIQMRALRYLLKKERHASTITSDVTDYDTYWIHFIPREQSSESEEGETSKAPESVRMLVEPEPDKPLQARRMRELHGEKQKPRPLTPALIKGAEFEIRHFYKDTETMYTSPVTAALSRFTGMFWLFRVWNEILKANASRKTKFLRERKTVLETIVKLDDERVPGISNFSVAREIKGPDLHLVRGEKKLRYLRHIRRIIESLVFTEEVRYDANRKTYTPTGKCMASLLEWERELRIHRAHVMREAIIILFTLVIAAGTAIQAYQALYGTPP
ncbi:hypothetical protein [Marinobacter salarius]|uniref:hypothetical protein n=1 Tax=Marinobacter salarius TaxID=1420917 RepID=UPI003BAA24F3